MESASIGRGEEGDSLCFISNNTCLCDCLLYFIVHVEFCGRRGEEGRRQHPAREYFKCNKSVSSAVLVFLFGAVVSVSVSYQRVSSNPGLTHAHHDAPACIRL